MNAPTRYCHPCKTAGVKTPAYETNSGFNGRARVNGLMTNVCPMHRDALTVTRATVAGQGASTRQAIEGAIFHTTTAVKAAARVVDLSNDRDGAIKFLTQTHLNGMHRAASRERNVMLADALFDTYFDEAVKRIGNAIFNGKKLTPADVDQIVWTACKSNASERRRVLDARLDMPIGPQGDTLHSVIGEKAADTDPLAWRVGGMTVTVADLAGLVAGDKPAGLSDADWADLKATYLA